MRATLVRIGIDQAYGGWNAPVDPESNEFVYVPIPEGVKAPQYPTWRRRTRPPRCRWDGERLGWLRERVREAG